MPGPSSELPAASCSGPPGGRWWPVWAQAAWSRRAAGCLVVRLLAGGADQPAERVPRPAHTGRAGPVIGLAERGVARHSS